MKLIKVSNFSWYRSCWNFLVMVIIKKSSGSLYFRSTDFVWQHELSLWLLILYYIHVLNILTSIFTMFVRKWFARSWLFITLTLLIKFMMCLPKVSPWLDSNFFGTKKWSAHGPLVWGGVIATMDYVFDSILSQHPSSHICSKTHHNIHPATFVISSFWLISVMPHLSMWFLYHLSQQPLTQKLSFLSQFEMFYNSVEQSRRSGIYSITSCIKPLVEMHIQL